MKTTNFFHAILMVFAITVTSCTDDKEILDPEEPSQQEADQEMESSYSLLDHTPNVYYDFFAEADNIVGFSSLKPGPLQDFSIFQSSDIANSAEKGRFVINKKQLANKNGSSAIGKSGADAIFGQMVRISIESKKGSTFKDGSTSKEVEMYVPEQLEISNPRVESEEELMPFCFSEDFVLEWNADPKNKEGLVVIAEYIGISAVPSKDKSIHIMNTDVIEEDNGRAVLDNEIWKGIPNSGVVHLTLLRGNVKIEEIDEENYKFFAEARAVLPMILINDLDILE